MNPSTDAPNPQPQTIGRHVAPDPFYCLGGDLIALQNRLTKLADEYSVELSDDVEKAQQLLDRVGTQLNEMSDDIRHRWDSLLKRGEVSPVAIVGVPAGDDPDLAALAPIQAVSLVIGRARAQLAAITVPDVGERLANRCIPTAGDSLRVAQENLDELLLNLASLLTGERDEPRRMSMTPQQRSARMADLVNELQYDASLLESQIDDEAERDLRKLRSAVKALQRRVAEKGGAS
ncbi:MAG: hypothetical protein WD009_06405 [Phycisphaeraceae bacterium]